jgi:hypothetical protein
MSKIYSPYDVMSDDKKRQRRINDLCWEMQTTVSFRRRCQLHKERDRLMAVEEQACPVMG